MYHVRRWYAFNPTYFVLQKSLEMEFVKITTMDLIAIMTLVIVVWYQATLLNVVTVFVMETHLTSFNLMLKCIYFNINQYN